MLSDSHFTVGEIRNIVVGNPCRLLDKRRTPGVIRSINLNSGFFQWEITDFEDKGKFWEVEFENILNYQFNFESRKLDDNQTAIIQQRIDELNKFVSIANSESEKLNSLSQINQISQEIEAWSRTSSSFLKLGSKIDFQSTIGPSSLQEDLKSYMMAVDLLDIETKTAESQVLNPYSGDWIRATQIIMAEMGFKGYFGKSVRSNNTFKGVGSRENRRKYILHRLAFVRCLFKSLGLNEVELFRAMSTERSWVQPKEPRFWSSWTFNFKVAQDFSNLEPATKYKNSYLVKRAIPIGQIFMTYLETAAMNNQYKEAEAIVLHEQSDAIFW